MIGNAMPTPRAMDVEIARKLLDDAKKSGADLGRVTLSCRPVESSDQARFRTPEEFKAAKFLCAWVSPS